MNENGSNTYTITGGPLRPHEYVVVKREMSAADEAWIQNHSATVTGDRRNPQVQLTIGDVKLAALKRMIVAWNLTKTDGASGQEVPIVLTEKTIEEMPRRVATYINRVIDKLNPEEEESDEDFPPGANGSSEGGSHPERMAQLKP